VHITDTSLFARAQSAEAAADAAEKRCGELRAAQAALQGEADALATAKVQARPCASACRSRRLCPVPYPQLGLLMDRDHQAVCYNRACKNSRLSAELCNRPCRVPVTCVRSERRQARPSEDALEFIPMTCECRRCWQLQQRSARRGSLRMLLAAAAARRRRQSRLAAAFPRCNREANHATQRSGLHSALHALPWKWVV